MGQKEGVCYVGGAKPPDGSMGVRYGWRGMQRNLMGCISGGAADTNDESPKRKG
jgi:hypothetical protein